MREPTQLWPLLQDLTRDGVYILPWTRNSLPRCHSSHVQHIAGRLPTDFQLLCNDFGWTISAVIYEPLGCRDLHWANVVDKWTKSLRPRGTTVRQLQMWWSQRASQYAHHISSWTICRLTWDYKSCRREWICNSEQSRWVLLPAPEMVMEVNCLGS